MESSGDQAASSIGSNPSSSLVCARKLDIRSLAFAKRLVSSVRSQFRGFRFFCLLASSTTTTQYPPSKAAAASTTVARMYSPFGPFSLSYSVSSTKSRSSTSTTTTTTQQQHQVTEQLQWSSSTAPCMSGAGLREKMTNSFANQAASYPMHNTCLCKRKSFEVKLVFKVYF